MLDGLPALDQDVLSVAAEFLDPALTGTDGYSLVVDGMEVGDLGVSQSAITEIKINKNPYSAEFYSPGRGRIEVKTRKGASAFHGAFNFLVRDHRLNARHAFAETRPPEFRRVYEGHLTGPLDKSGKTTFLVSGEYRQDDEWRLVYAHKPEGLFTTQAHQPDRETEFSFRVNRMRYRTTSRSPSVTSMRGSRRSGAESAASTCRRPPSTKESASTRPPSVIAP